MNNFFGLTTDESGVLTSTRDNVWVFNATAISTTIGWQTWTKPSGVSMVYMIAIGGGGGGGGGQSDSQSGARSGGGGGGGSAVTVVIYPAAFLPDVLQILVGVGGAGGAAYGHGESGKMTYVSISKNIIANDVLLASGFSAANGGEDSSSGEGGWVDTFTSLFGNAISAGWKSIAGMRGSIGVQLGLPITSGGSVGGLVDASHVGFDGGWVEFRTAVYTNLILGGVAAGAGGLINGGAGVCYWQRLMFSGGSGGGANALSGTGGIGGAGGPGSGGGGGGAGVTGGTGGTGGGGLVIIAAW